ncbi:MAG: hypothetical protein OXE41_05910 [Gammaproteobacteria bacterium]|nr:hypothetical protein [Gammaproteobacteria bacterium]MCY4217811.1 hypothetical protein [Gammaproteobacteria bacterium]MCY4274913.1 hypothetical protein [Gammaproteobacteria bacterium]
MLSPCDCSLVSGDTRKGMACKIGFGILYRGLNDFEQGLEWVLLRIEFHLALTR